MGKRQYKDPEIKANELMNKLADLMDEYGVKFTVDDELVIDSEDYSIEVQDCLVSADDIRTANIYIGKQA